MIFTFESCFIFLVPLLRTCYNVKSESEWRVHMAKQNKAAERKKMAVRIFAGVVAVGLVVMIILPSLLGAY